MMSTQDAFIFSFICWPLIGSLVSRKFKRNAALHLKVIFPEHQRPDLGLAACQAGHHQHKEPGRGGLWRQCVHAHLSRCGLGTTCR